MAQAPKNPSLAKQPIENLKAGGFVGDACGADATCRPGLHCLGVFGDGQGAYPQGMCSTICPKDTCYDDAAYPYSRCVAWKHESEAICMIGCNDQGRCDRPGYECDRVDRSDGEGTRYVCVPRPGSAANALAAARVEGTVQAPPGTVSLPSIIGTLRGTPAEFGVSSLLPPARPAPEAIQLGEAQALADAEAAAATSGGGQAAASEGASANTAAGGEDATTAHTAEAPGANATPPPRETSQVLSITIIVVVALITLISIIRMLTTGRVGGVLRNMRQAADDETPLERIRREARKRRVQSGAPEDRPEVRVSRRNPTRPIRGMTTTHVGAAIEQSPVIPREEAIARKIIPEPPEPEPVEEPPAQEPPPAPEPEPAGPALFTPEQLGSYGEAPSLVPAAPLRNPPVRPADWMAPPDPEHPLMDVGRPLATKLWAGAKAARAFGAPRALAVHDQLPTLIDMDEFVAPLPIDIVLQLLDELLEHAELLRQRKGYEAIVYIETDPRQTWFRRGPEGKIRIQYAADAFSKPALATDAMRRKGFNPSMKVSDAHLLSLVHLGRYLLGSVAPDDIFLTIDALSAASARFSDEERQLVEFLLAPEEHEQLQRVASSRQRDGGGAPSTSTAGVVAPASGPVEDLLPCPSCASEVRVGDLACRHCGTPLHPRPAFCSVCGTRNVLLADGSPQRCLNMSCDAELLHGATRADVEGRRLTIIAELLASFDEFRKLPAHAGQERYEATTQGRRVEVWQLAGERGTVLVEDDRPHYGLSDLVTLPSRVVDRSGVQFVIYDPPAATRHPLYTLGGELLAERILVLLEELHGAKLRAAALAVEDLSVSESGEVCLLHGHILRSATAPTPRVVDARFVAPELARQALATERSDLYTAAAIWFFVMTGELPSEGSSTAAHEAFLGVPERTVELMQQCLQAEAPDRPESARYVLTQLRRRRRLTDLV